MTIIVQPSEVVGTAVVDGDARLSNARTPTAHAHAEGDVTGLTAALAGKAASGHNHSGVYEPANANIQAHVISAHAPANAQANADITKAEIEAKLTGVISSHSHTGGAASWGGIGGTLSSQTDLQTALDGKVATSHVGTGGAAHANVVAAGSSGFMTGADKSKLDGIAAGATVNSSDSTLLARSNHTGTQSADTLTDGVTNKVFLAAERTKLTGIQAGAQVNADITKAEIESKLIGVITSHSHSGGGSDPWTYLKLAADFTTNSATAVDVAGLSFIPSANLSYEFEAFLKTRTATATVGPRPGLAWATGLSDGAALIKQPSAATTELTTYGNISAAMLCAVGGVPTTTGSWLARVTGCATAGAAPSGTIKVQLASETAGTNVTIKAGSFLKYRTY